MVFKLNGKEIELMFNLRLPLFLFFKLIFFDTFIKFSFIQNLLTANIRKH